MIIPDETIEAAADKLLNGKPLTQAERRLLYSSQGDFALGQVRSILDARKRRAALAPPDAGSRG